MSDPATDTMKFVLYVISRAGFDVEVLWSHEEREQEAAGRNELSMDPTPLPRTQNVV